MQPATAPFDTPTDAAAATVPAAEAASCTDRQRDLLAMQRAVVAMGRRAIASPEVSVLVQDAAALVAEMLEADLSGVAEMSPDGKGLLLRLAVSAVEADEPQEAVCQADVVGSDSLAGYVLQVAHPVVVRDLAREKRFVDLWLRKQGIQSAVAAPLILPDRSFGSLGAYSRQVGYFDDDDLPFVETIAHLVATTVGRNYAERLVAEERRLSSGLLQTVDAMILMLNGQWQVVAANPACERITGFCSAEIERRSMWNIFGIAAGAETFRQILAKLQARVSPVDYESDLLTKHCSRRRIAWSFGATFDCSGAVERILATGIDITARQQPGQRTEQAERMGEEARRAAHAGDAADRGTGGNPSAATAGRPSPEAAERPIRAFQPLPLPPNAERRKRPRRSYPYSQMIAPIVDGKLPPRERFFEVKCNDVAAGGFSFISPQPPPFDSLVVALGIPPRITYLTAQVAHVARIRHNGQRMFLTGCNYTGRAEY